MLKPYCEIFGKVFFMYLLLQFKIIKVAEQWKESIC